MHSAIYAPFHTGLAPDSALAYNVKSDLNWTMAPVAELVDATDSKSVIREGVGVRVSLGAPIIRI